MILPPRFDSMTDRTVIGRGTRELIRARSPELLGRGLLLVGITWAKTPYTVVRHNLPDGHIVATVGGEGDLWYGGKWHRCREGDIFINPPDSPELFHAVPGREWNFCWAHTAPSFFDGYPERKPRLIRADPRPFHLALEGYLHCGRTENPELPGWANLVRNHAAQLLRSIHEEVRLWKLWAAVARDPAHPWDIPSLARLAGMSREQLRHHTQRETGRSPMQQVTQLRIRRAIELLETGNYKLDTIAELVGYSSGFALSNVFLKVTGKRPSAFATD